MKTRRISYRDVKRTNIVTEKRKPGRPRKKRENDLIEQNEQIQPNVQPPDQNGPNGINENLNQIYHNVRSTPSYSRKIVEFLRNNPTSSLHKQVRKNFPTRRIVVHYPYQTIMSDLIDYSHHKMPFANNGYRYIMVFVCCFSKMAWAEPLKRKTGIE